MCIRDREKEGGERERVWTERERVERQRGDGETDRYTERDRDRQTDRQTETQTERDTDRQTDRQTELYCRFFISSDFHSMNLLHYLPCYLLPIKCSRRNSC